MGRWKSIYKWYIDTFVITLCLVDFVAYLLATYILGRSSRIKGCLLFAIGSSAAETVLYIVMPRYILYRLVMLFVINPIVTAGLLYPVKKKEVLTGYLLITAVILFVGGIQTLFLYWVPAEGGTWAWNILLAMGAVFICFLQRNKKRQNQYLYQVELTINGRQIRLKACHDTGNFLRDPFTGKMVSVVDASCLKDADIHSENLRYIPFHTVGMKHGLMQVLTIDKMLIRQGEKEIEKIQPVIGLAQGDLFLKQDIQMILHSEMI